MWSYWGYFHQTFMPSGYLFLSSETPDYFYGMCYCCDVMPVLKTYQVNSTFTGSSPDEENVSLHDLDPYRLFPYLYSQ